MALRTLVAMVVLALLAQGCSDEGGSDGDPGAPVVVALGDSIAANEPGQCPGCTGFVDAYAEQAGAEVVNLARGGALTRSIGQQITSGEVADELEDADLVLVSWGGNDLPPYRQGYQPCRVEEPATVVEAVEALAATTTGCVDRVTRRLARTVLDALTALREQAPDADVAVLAPYNWWLGWPALDAAPERARRAALRVVTYAVRSWRDALCNVAAAVQVTCVDLSSAFNGPDGDRPAGDLLGPDHTHPSQAGNDLILDLLLDANL